MSYHNRDDIVDMELHKKLQYIINNKWPYCRCFAVIGKICLEQCFLNSEASEGKSLDSGFFECYSRFPTLETLYIYIQNILQSE